MGGKAGVDVTMPDTAERNIRNISEVFSQHW